MWNLDLFSLYFSHFSFSYFQSVVKVGYTVYHTKEWIIMRRRWWYCPEQPRGYPKLSFCISFMPRQRNYTIRIDVTLKTGKPLSSALSISFTSTCTCIEYKQQPLPVECRVLSFDKEKSIWVYLILKTKNYVHKWD